MFDVIRKSLLASVLLLFAGVAAVPSQEPPAGPPADPGMSEAQSYARRAGVDVAEAARRFELQEQAGRLEAELAEKEAATFAGLWIEHQPAFRIVVAFTADSAARTRRYVGSGPLAPYAEPREAATSYADLVQAQTAAIERARALDVAFDAGIDVKRNRAEIYVLDAAAFRAALAEREARLPANVEVIEVDQLSVDEAEIYAGVSLSTCTCGWSVQNASGVKGVTTAGHCGPDQSYGGVSLPYKNEKYSGSCDVQWHDDATYTAVPKFIGSEPSLPRTLTATLSRSSQAVGSYVCKWGKTTGYTCGDILDKNFKPSSPSDALATYIRVHAAGVNLSEGGDSGGPWFNSNTGYGIHKCGIGDDSCYTAINYVSSCLGLTVLTQ